MAAPGLHEGMERTEIEPVTSGLQNRTNPTARSASLRGRHR